MGSHKLTRKKRETQFIEKATIKHDAFYNYDKVAYENAHTKITIICPEHGPFTQTPNSHLTGRGCPDCGDIKLTNKVNASRISLQEFINRATHIHGEKYNYDLVNYINANTKVKIKCKTHSTIFDQTPSKHLLQKTGCPLCGRQRAADINRKTKQQFIEAAHKVHGTQYAYDNVVYIDIRTPVEIVCREHGSFWQSPTNHIHSHNENGCPKCTPTKYSNAAIEWLEYRAKMDGIYIRHALNGGEYKVPGTRLHTDGYCDTTNTVYEYYGDAFHGNLQKYSESRYCNPFDTTKTAKQLWDKTKEREEILRNLGYNIVTIWESEWNELRRSLKND